MNFRHVLLTRNRFASLSDSRAYYSRRNNSNHESNYKVVSKIDNTNQQKDASALAPIPNWEILKPRGYRFFLPGNVGIGWHDVRSNPHSLPQDFDLETTDFKCYAQECPVLLRQIVAELFPGIDFSYSLLSVVTLTQRNLKHISENETEAVVKTFVLAAQDICQKIRNAGYWADFINPFSGIPGISTYSHPGDLYSTDTRFRSLGFHVMERQHCRIILEDKKTSCFRGNLFTSAPVHADVMQEILMPFSEFK